MNATIEEAGLLPEIVADTVICELLRATGDNQPLLQHFTDGVIRTCADALADKARDLYARNEAFARKCRRTSGREWLYSFMRHWLAAYVLDKLGRRVFNALPAQFWNGCKP